MDNYIFKRPIEEYNINLDPLKEYVKQASYYISKKYNIPLKEAAIKVKNALSKIKIKDPIVKYNARDDKGDKIVKENTLTEYIKETLANGDIIVPSFTVYSHPSKQKSIHADFLSINIAKRKEDKYNQFKYEQLGDKTKALYYKTLQKVRKIFNNSLSGAYASNSTILYNPSAHYTLTSITRCIASIGNAITESIVAGNKLIKSQYAMLNYITAIIANVNIDKVKQVIDKYNLYKPTPNDVMDMLLYSSRNYWTDLVFENKVLDFLSKLTEYELAAILYVNDLFHIKKHNDSFIRNLLDKLSTKVEYGSTDYLKDIKEAPEGITNLVNHIWLEEIKGLTIDYKELADTNPELLQKLASTTKYITNTLREYKDFFNVFFTTNILPIDIAYIKDMLRDSIVLSDTDSTCGSYDHWVEWYFGKLDFSPKAIGIAAAVMTINTQAMDHNIKVFARNMNIPESSIELLKMKNEFFWNIFVTANASKHYFARTISQEGNIYKNPKPELKGVHLIASNIDTNIVKIAHDLIEEIADKTTNNEKLDIRVYINKVIEVEKSILNKIKNGDIDIYKKERIKNSNSYKLSEEESPYFHHILWNTVFGEKYGYTGEPEYNVIKIPTILKNKNTFLKYLEDIEDKNIANKLKYVLEKANKDSLGTFKLPIAIVGSIGIPSEIIPAIDYKRIILDNCNIFYMILETIGYYRKPDTLILELY